MSSTKLHMFLSDANLSYSAWAASEQEARVAIQAACPAVGRLVYLGAQ